MKTIVRILSILFLINATALGQEAYNMVNDPENSIKIELTSGTARIAGLAADGTYDGVVFHRVIEGFMAQTGDVQYGKDPSNLSQAGRGGSDQANLPAEFSELPFDRGVVGMARSQNPNSANSQFFIMFERGYFLLMDSILFLVKSLKAWNLLMA